MLRFGDIRDNLSISHHGMQPLVAQYNLSDWMRHTACEFQFVTISWGSPGLSAATKAYLPPENICLCDYVIGKFPFCPAHTFLPEISQYQRDTLRDGWSNLYLRYLRFTLTAITWPKGEVPQSQWLAVG